MFRPPIPVVECRLNRYREPTRWIDTNEAARQFVEQWVATSDGSEESLILAFEAYLKGILVALCDS